ncbi:MAG: DUF4199 domain-containing protein [Flavobacteriales bacterium]|nr:DUF4199 domain-containing protein [Flavobacteriales bacterium]
MSISKYAFGAGMLSGAVLAVITLGGKIPSLASVIWAIRLIALVALTMYFVRTYRDKYHGGYINGAEVFSLTFQIFLYIGIVAGLYSLITMTIMPSDQFETAIQITQESYSDAGVDISGVDFEKVMKLIPYFTAFFMLLGHIIIGLIFGAIYSSSFRREKPNETPFE